VTTNDKRKLAAMAAAMVVLIPAEGLRQYAYTDPPGILTVCYGHTGKDVERNRKYSLEECNAFLDQDMRKAVEIVERCHPGLPEKVLAAFADAVYNIGPRVACDDKQSTASRYLRAGKFADACRELPKWSNATVAGVKVKLPGLVKRRAQERDLCLEGAVA
jgi:GH24 family phage-related lysozyme (muramidase)